MADPINATDPAIIVGIMAALVAISLALRTKRAGMAEIETEHDRATWMTGAAGSVLERAADLLDRGVGGSDTDASATHEPALVDLTDSVDLTEKVDLTDSIDLTEVDSGTTDEPTS